MRMHQFCSFALAVGVIATSALGPTTASAQPTRPPFRQPTRPPFFQPTRPPFFQPTRPPFFQPPALGRFNLNRSFGPSSFNATFTGSTPFGPFSFSANRSLGPNSLTATFTRSTPFDSANFRQTSTLSGSLNNFLTLTRSLNLSETINGHTANFSTTGSVNFTAAQLAASLLARQIRRNEVVAQRQAMLAAVYPGYGSPTGAALYSAPGYMGTGYGGPFAAYPYAYPSMNPSYGGGASQAGMQVAGAGANAPEQAGASRLRTASGTEEETRLAWPVGLRSLPGARPAELRDRVESLLNQEAREAAAGPVPDRLYRDVTSALDALRSQLLRDREERFSLTYQAYDDAEDYLAKLKQTAKKLVEVGKAAGQEGRNDKPGGRTEPGQGPEKMVSIVENSFNPPTLEVAAGTTVHWTNDSKHKHTVTSDKGDWGSQELAPGAAYSYTFSRPGTYLYHCQIHTDMRGSVVVK